MVAAGSREREALARALKQAAQGQMQAQQQLSGSSAGRAALPPSADPPAVPHAHLEAQKQQRLLQLLHAGDCDVPLGGGCTALNCELFKQSLPHYMGCQDSNCVQRHCASSRFCLMHWAACTDAHCEVCPGVNREFGRSARAQATRKQLLPQQPAGSNGGNGQFAGVKRSASSGGASGDSSAAEHKRLRPDPSAGPSHAQLVASIFEGKVPGMSREQWMQKPVEEQQAWLQQRPTVERAVVKPQLAGAPGDAASSAPPPPPPRASSKARIDGNCTLIATMGKADILRHLTSLREDCSALVSPEQIRVEMGEILNRIFDQARGEGTHIILATLRPSCSLPPASAGPEVCVRVRVPGRPRKARAPRLL